MYDLIALFVLLALGYFFGRAAEARHYKSIRMREHAYRNILAIASKIPPPGEKPEATILVSGSVVISVDYFKRFLAGLRNLVGGRMVSYESLLDRGRREALLRMKQQAKKLGANRVFNIKLETASISGNNRGGVGSIEVLAYGTALVPLRDGGTAS